jgi:IS5 family transposase
MIGKQSRNTDQVQSVSTAALVPPKHVLRRLHAALDLSFVRERVAPFYSEIGRHSIDPEVVARMWILQHYYGFSEREVCDEVTMHAGFRWFCGLSFQDPVPDPSTLVKLRTVKWAASGLWQALLEETVRACEAPGIARGKWVGIDGTQITANAAIVSLEAIPPTLTVGEGTARSQEPAGVAATPASAAADLPAVAAEQEAADAGAVTPPSPRARRRVGLPPREAPRREIPSPHRLPC